VGEGGGVAGLMVLPFAWINLFTSSEQEDFQAVLNEVRVSDKERLLLILLTYTNCFDPYHFSISSLSQLLGELREGHKDVAG
jgi:cytochrome oxidase Cu insertion factor (SCO1/SenC/PrrC family)